MPDAHLYHKVRQLLEKGSSIQEVKSTLGLKHRPKEIERAVKEFYKDEKTSYDDKLVKQIEKKLRGKKHKGELLQDIFSELVSEGHKPFEIEKAMLRAEVRKGCDLQTEVRKWEFYSLVQIGIVIATILLGIFYTPLYFFATVFIFIEMLIASLGIPNSNRMWKTEITVMPLGGIHVTDGIYGYNGLIGNYWRWWIMDPALVLMLFFMLFGMFGFIYYGTFFLFSSLYLGLMSFFSFSIKNVGTSGPPYMR